MYCSTLFDIDGEHLCYWNVGIRLAPNTLLLPLHGREGVARNGSYLAYYQISQHDLL